MPIISPVGLVFFCQSHKNLFRQAINSHLVTCHSNKMLRFHTECRRKILIKQLASTQLIGIFEKHLSLLMRLNRFLHLFCTGNGFFWFHLDIGKIIFDCLKNSSPFIRMYQNNSVFLLLQSQICTPFIL